MSLAAWKSFDAAEKRIVLGGAAVLLVGMALCAYALIPQLRACGNALNVWLRGGTVQASMGIADPPLKDTDNHDYVITKQPDVTQVVYFGYTHCPDECPTALSKMARAYDELGQPRRLRLVFVSFDPQRDTPRVLGAYVRLFKAPMVGLGGSTAAVRATMKRFGADAVRIPPEQPGAGYSFAHTSSVIVVGPDNSSEAMYPIEDMDVHDLVKTLHRYLW